MSSKQTGVDTWTSGQREPADYAVFGIVVYLILGVGTFLYRVLIDTIVSEDDDGLYTVFEPDVPLDAATSAFATVDAGSGFVIALGLGAFYYFVVQLGDDAPKAAGIAAGAGTAVTLLIFFVLALVFDSDAVSISPDIIGLVVSVALAAVVAAAVPLALDAAEDQVS